MINNSIYLWARTSNLSGKYSILHFQTFSPFVSKSWILRLWHSFPTFLFFFVQKRLFTKEIAKLGETNLTTNPSCKNLLIFLSTKKWNWNGFFFCFFFFAMILMWVFVRNVPTSSKKIWGKKFVYKLMRLITFWDPVYFSMGANYLA